MPAFCRDCLTILEMPAPKHCPNCRSARLLVHDELFDLNVSHVDCDAFFAAVEKRDNPDWRDKPVIIGGTGSRGVVSTACYMARLYGVRSAMPMYKARKLCPDAIFASGDHKKYRQVSRQIRALFEELTPAVEPLSVDEAFLDLSGTERLHHMPPALQLAQLVNKIEDQIGITASIGLSHNKFLAKLASDLEKPRGFSVIGKAETKERLAALPITKIYGVGKAFARTLERDGLTMIGQLQAMDETRLARRYGEMGLRLARLSQGQDNRLIKTSRVAKSVSSERTFGKDLRTRDALERELWQACERVSEELKQKDIGGETVHLKLKTSTHKLITRSKTLPAPINAAHRLFEETQPMLTALAGVTAYRLLGVGLSRLQPHQAVPIPDLASPERARDQDIEHAMDKVRAKFGTGAVIKGRLLGKK